jgi:hypothetical protein
VNVAFFGTDTFVPLAANRIHRVGSLAAGLVITGASLTWSAGAAISARQSGRRPPDRVVRLGFAIVAIGVAATAPVAFGSTPLWVTFACWTFAGLGIGLVFNTTTVSAMAGAPAGREGLVSSQLQTADTLGFAMAGGVGGALVGLADRGLQSLDRAARRVRSGGGRCRRRHRGRTRRPSTGSRTNVTRSSYLAGDTAFLSADGTSIPPGRLPHGASGPGNDARALAAFDRAQPGSC